MSGIMGNLQGVLGNLPGKFFSVLDRILPPEQRAKFLDKIKNFAVKNPKVAAFLTTQIVLTGFPLLLFITFAITVGLFALIAALLIGLLGAVLFTVLMLGVALVVVLPTLFFTTFAATFIFLLGLGGYYIFKTVNESPAEPGTAIGDKLNGMTGGRLSWLIDGAKKTEDDKRTGVDKTPKAHGNEENEHTSATTSGSDAGGKSTTTKSSPPKLNKTSGNTTNGAEPANKTTAGAKTAASTAKSAAGGTGDTD